MVLAPEHPLVDQIIDRGSAAARSQTYRRAGRREVRSRTHRTGEGEDRRLHRRLRDQSGQRRTDPDLDRRLRADGLRHRRDHGRARRTTSATSSSRASSSLPIRAGRRRARSGEDGRTDMPIGCFSGDGIADQLSAHRRPADAGSEEQDHRLARSRRASADATYQLQTARLALHPAALLGRAVPDCLARRQASTPLPEANLPLDAAGAGRFQTHRHRRTAARARRRTGCVIPTTAVARDEHHAAMGGLVLVLPAVLRSAKRQRVSSAKKRNDIGWADAQTGRRRSLRRRHRARRAASALRAVLAQGALRSRLSLHARAVPGWSTRG